MSDPSLSVKGDKKDKKKDENSLKVSTDKTKKERRKSFLFGVFHFYPIYFFSFQLLIFLREKKSRR